MTGAREKITISTVNIRDPEISEHQSNAAATPSPWMTATDAAVYVGLPSVKALYQAVRRGAFPVHRLGRRMRFHRAELDRLLMSK